MKWFTGNIPGAINASKSKGSLFVVYIFGKIMTFNRNVMCFRGVYFNA